METVLLWPIYLGFSDPLHFLTRVTCLHVCLPRDSRLLKVIAHLFTHLFIHSTSLYWAPAVCQACAGAGDVDGTKTAPFLLEHDPPFSRNTGRDDGKVCWGPDKEQGHRRGPDGLGWRPGGWSE